jgi:hypothetical protein
LTSILLAAKEIWISVQALNMELNSIAEIKKKLHEESEDLYLSQNIKKISTATKNILLKDKQKDEQ